MKDREILYSWASGWYLVPDDPVTNVNAHAPKLRVGMETGQPQEYDASCELPLDGMPPGLFGRIMWSFWHNLLWIEIMCDKDFKFLFTIRSMDIYDNNEKPFLSGWRETNMANM